MKKYPVLVCVTAQSSCESIILQGRQAARELSASLEVVSVQSADMAPEQRAASLNTLYKLSKKSGAPIVVYYNDDAAQTIASHARQHSARHIILGQSNNHHFARQLAELLPGVNIAAARIVGNGQLAVDRYGVAAQ